MRQHKHAAVFMQVSKATVRIKLGLWLGSDLGLGLDHGYA